MRKPTIFTNYWPISTQEIARNREFTLHVLHVNQRRYDGPFGLWRTVRRHRHLCLLLFFVINTLIALLIFFYHAMSNLPGHYLVW